MSEIHAGSNNFSRGISTSWSDKEHMRRPQKKSFSFLFQTTINSFSFYGSTISPSCKYLDSSCTKGGPHNYFQLFSRHFITGNHTVNHMLLIPLEKLYTNRDSVRKACEAFLIHRGNTLEPAGLNRRDEM